MSENIEQQNTAADESLSDESLESVSGGLSIAIGQPVIGPIICRPLPEPIVCPLPEPGLDTIVKQA